jgi:[protein-PII] uridylyltransferase
MFWTPTQVNFSVDARNDRTILELIAADRPGLLSEVGKVFRAERVAINGAKIMTVGERAEDVFYITREDGGLLKEDVCRRVQESLMQALDRRDAARS